MDQDSIAALDNVEQGDTIRVGFGDGHKFQARYAGISRDVIGDSRYWLRLTLNGHIIGVAVSSIRTFRVIRRAEVKP